MNSEDAVVVYSAALVGRAGYLTFSIISLITFAPFISRLLCARGFLKCPHPDSKENALHLCALHLRVFYYKGTSNFLSELEVP